MTCATCPRPLTKTERAHLCRRCRQCRKANPGRPDVTGRESAKRPHPRHTWREYPTVAAKPSKPQPAPVHDSWWLSASPDGFTAAAVARFPLNIYTLPVVPDAFETGA